MRFDSIYPVRRLDLSAIDAVGFDLDHTLALYDDQAVNLLAAQETIGHLEGRGYPRPALQLECLPPEAVRGLSMDLRHGNIVKIGADGRVRVARRGAQWLSEETIAARYGHHDPADDAATWHVHSPFDAPTLWFFSALGPDIHDAHDAAVVARLLKDIRASLDMSHTRGELKAHLARDLARFVSPAGAFLHGLEQWKRAGKKLFVVTNSDRSFATRVLDHVVGDHWGELFDMVSTDAAKPRFFLRTEDGAAMVEERLGVRPERILYAGDNARADIVPARRRGWRTVHVVAELSAAGEETAWAGALEHENAPTWFAKTIFDHADAACARIDELLALDPRSVLDSGEDFYARILRRRATRAHGNAP
jgi:HAD superfamily 5'-nucleotidase-like hydrolase